MKIKADREAAIHRFENSSLPVTFILFRRFAPEIRRLIWKHAANEVRLVEFTYVSKEKTIGARFPSRTLVPAILHTSKEAREVGLQIYEKLDFGSSFLGINSTYINWEHDVVTFKAGRALQAFMEHQRYIQETLENRGDVMEQLGIDPIHSIITEKCCNLAVFSKDLIDFKMELRPKIVFKKLNNFIVIAPSGELGTWMDGNLALAPLAEGTATFAIDLEIQSLQLLYNQKDDAGWGVFEKKICIMDVVRERHRLMTAEEKQARHEVRQGKEKLAGARAVKGETFACPKTKAQLEEEAKQRQFDADLIWLPSMYSSFVRLDDEANDFSRLQTQNL
jgi:hypothetical protein